MLPSGLHPEDEDFIAQLIDARPDLTPNLDQADGISFE
jgi:hypothetical protein